jgi:hypothetical protein
MVKPFVAILEDSFEHVEDAGKAAFIGINFIEKFFRYGFPLAYLTDKQRTFLRQNTQNEKLNVIVLDLLTRKKIDFPKCPDSLYEYRSLKINEGNFDHLIFSGFFCQPIISILNVFDQSNQLVCEYEYLDFNTTKTLHKGKWIISCYHDYSQIEADRKVIEDLAKVFIFRNYHHSFTTNPVPVINEFPQLKDEARTMDSAMTGYTVTKAKELGIRIAYINLWKVDSALSKRNGRIVLKSDHAKYYLAIDTQHPEFEKHDFDGSHLGSISFCGDVEKKVKDHRLKF